MYEIRRSDGRVLWRLSGKRSDFAMAAGTAQANAQFLAGGHVFVGWGAQPYFTEFAQNGRVLLDGHFGSGADS